MDRAIIQNILTESCCQENDVPCNSVLVFESVEGEMPFQQPVEVNLSGKLVIERYKNGKSGESTGARSVQIVLDSAAEKSLSAAIMKAVSEGVGNCNGGQSAVRGKTSISVPGVICNDEYLELESQGD